MRERRITAQPAVAGRWEGLKPKGNQDERTF